MTKPTSFEQKLAEALPSTCRLRTYHLSTPPTPIQPIFSPPPGQANSATFCESHFLGIASAPYPDHHHSHSATFIFAIEILIFTTEALTTVFVSKADTSGFLAELNLTPGAPSLTRTILDVFLDHLLKPRLDTDHRIVLSLFARSQNQYLFPGSIDNPGKHVLDDRQLIKWWCRVLDQIWRRYDHEHGPDSNQIAAYLVVPGCDRGETKAFYPSSTRQDPASIPRWTNAYPIELIAPDDSLSLRSCIPRLPDDPKCRFLDDLDGDYIGPEGQWRNIKTLDQFWEMMSYRQECSAGRLVGFVWIVFSNPNLDDGTRTEIDSSFNSTNEILPTPAQSQMSSNHVVEHETTARMPSDNPVQLQSPPPSSPVLQPAIAQNVRQEASLENQPMSTNSSWTADWPLSSRGQIIISADNYSLLIDFLLELDFAGNTVAAESTLKFIDEANKYATAYARQHAEVETQKPCFGKIITGEQSAKTEYASTDSKPDQEIHAPPVNMLSGIRKKRKVDTMTPTEHTEHSNVIPQQLNGVSNAVVRKKSKLTDPTEGEAEEPSTSPDPGRVKQESEQANHEQSMEKTTNILDASLMRKKVKHISGK